MNGYDHRACVDENTKTVVRLTCGRGLTDNVISRWICAMPSSAIVIDATENLCGIFAESTDQHVKINSK